MTDKYLERIVKMTQFDSVSTYCRLVNKLLIELVGSEEFANLAGISANQKDNGVKDLVQKKRKLIVRDEMKSNEHIKTTSEEDP